MHSPAFEWRMIAKGDLITTLITEKTDMIEVDIMHIGTTEKIVMIEATEIGITKVEEIKETRRSEMN